MRSRSCPYLIDFNLCAKYTLNAIEFIPCCFMHEHLLSELISYPITGIQNRLSEVCGQKPPTRPFPRHEPFFGSDNHQSWSYKARILHFPPSRQPGSSLAFRTNDGGVISAPGIVVC